MVARCSQLGNTGRSPASALPAHGLQLPAVLLVEFLVSCGGLGQFLIHHPFAVALPAFGRLMTRVVGLETPGAGGLRQTPAPQGFGSPVGHNVKLELPLLVDVPKGVGPSE